jgi:hypothetical protein
MTVASGKGRVLSIRGASRSRVPSEDSVLRRQARRERDPLDCHQQRRPPDAKEEGFQRCA